MSQTNGDEIMGNQEWYCEQTVIATVDPLLRRINIDVSLNNERDFVLFHLSGFMAAP